MSSKLTLKDCLIIHLERSLERKPQVRKLEKDLPYRTKVVEAVDGRNPDNDFSKRYTTKLLRPRYPLVCAQLKWRVSKVTENVGRRF